MKRALLFPLLLVSISCAFGDVEWKPKCNMDNQLFPSLILATATQRPDTDDEEEPDEDVLGDKYGLLGISIKAPTAGAKVKVTVKENTVMSASSWSGTLEKAGERYFVAPKLNYKFDQLRKARQQVPLNVTFAVEVDGKSAGEQAETVAIHSINDCPWAVLEVEETIDDEPEAKDAEPTKSAQKKEAQKKEEADAEDADDKEDAESSGANEWEDLGWMGAAYVNEGSPIVDQILKEALEYGWVGAFAGYQGKPEDVMREVLAVWSALQARGIRYSSITATPGGSERVHSQHIRFVDESIANQQANCADGSVMFCSILRKLGLRTFVVYLPGHMFMGFYPSRTGDERVAIETTMLSNEDAQPKIIKELQGLYATFSDDNKDEPDWKTFAAAVAVGTGNLQKYAAEFESEENANYQIIDIDEARKDGIMPISYEKY